MQCLKELLLVAFGYEIYVITATPQNIAFLVYINNRLINAPGTNECFEII